MAKAPAEIKKNVFRERLAELGYSLSEEDFNHSFEAFEELQLAKVQKNVCPECVKRETEGCKDCDEEVKKECELYKTTCQGAGKKLPDREKIAKIIYADWGMSDWDKLMEAEKETWLRTADQIIKEVISE